MDVECLSREAFTKKLEQDRELLPFINKVSLKRIYRKINAEIDKLKPSEQESCYIASKIGAEILTGERFFCQKIIAFGENLNARPARNVEWANHQAIIIKVVDGGRRNRFITNHIVDPVLGRLLGINEPIPFNIWTLKLSNLASFNANEDVLIYYEIFPHFFIKPSNFSFNTQFDTCRYVYLDKDINSIDPNSLLNPNSLI